MKFLKKMKDGGAESSVTGYWLVEIKSLFSIVLLKFEGESRDAYHEHAFNCVNWLIKGQLLESVRAEDRTNYKPGEIKAASIRFYKPSWKPFFIGRDRFHKVDSCKTSWVLSFRGPWSNTWKEYLPAEERYRTLTHGRKEV
jgi:hypothetical protein